MSVRIEIKDSTNRLPFDKLQIQESWEAEELRQFLNDELHPLPCGSPYGYTVIEGFTPQVAWSVFRDGVIRDGFTFIVEERENDGHFAGDVVVLTTTNDKDIVLGLLDRIRELIATSLSCFDDDAEAKCEHTLKERPTGVMQSR